MAETFPRSIDVYLLHPFHAKQEEVAPKGHIMFAPVSLRGIAALGSPRTGLCAVPPGLSLASMSPPPFAESLSYTVFYSADLPKFT